MNNKVARIQVLIDDLRKFAHVITLVDREDFLADIDKLRKEWKLDNLLNEKELKYWGVFPGYKYVEENKIKLLRYKNKRHEQLYKKYKDIVDLDKLERLMWNLSDLEDMGIKTRDELTELYRLEIIGSIFEYFRYQVEEMRKKYKRPPNFDQIIAHAVLFGAITEEDYALCEVEISNPDIENLPYLEESKLVITFYPLTTVDDIKIVFDQKKQNLVKKYEKKFIGGSVVDYDTMGNIQRDREWYWRRKEQNLSWSKLYASITPREAVITQDGVRKAVNEYEKRLRVEI
ncbi:hypothetical protein A3C59_02475 [Candidatus Daviesbacteria bacterium RIFCSPHIGHO2_02_FULL_36_13]|uniref:Uncharacterized protein n=1 Tax=Candidatus Daviesbacteria bacterium RIFCSPHIGHO2_02_FULL_36_13 TaxID=1797768 RepID=A0A1F5JMR2_9BACT|nr:MAG: hypothetical protein A3C59_02475 [Candidatus Daviesbacteria bacterium RIFCSPHIGHO2_02_FULL_36_13]